eukprot:5196597-Karenia_brevis.AAC.1
MGIWGGVPHHSPGIQLRTKQNKIIRTMTPINHPSKACPLNVGTLQQALGLCKPWTICWAPIAA